MILKRYLALPLFALLAFTACKKTGVTPNNPVTLKADTDIYVSGYVYASNNKAIATYWKNGVETKLSDSTTDSFGSSIAVDGTDVYIVGYELDTNYNTTAVCWKNGVKITLTDSAGSVARAMTISGGNVYIAGLIASYPSASLYWLNGTPYNINANSSQINPFAIAVSGTDIYVGGESALPDLTTVVATYWKNGTQVQLTNQYSYGYGIAVNGSDVYVAGDVLPDRQTVSAAYWKNGVQTILNPVGSAFAQAIAVNNTDVYVAGQTTLSDGKTTVAAYWKNGTLSTLSNVVSSTSAIAISGNNVYITGDAGGPVYWKNGVLTHLQGNGGASAIAVVPR